VTTTVVIGAGAAGLWCALHATDRGAVTVVAPGAAELSATAWAQGGIAAVAHADDSPELHAADTIAAGAGLCDLAAVDVLVQEAPQAVQELRAMGMRFDEGDASALEGGHSRRRVHHAGGDRSGQVLHRFLEETVERHGGIVRVDGRAVGIEMRDGVVVGVRVEGGALIAADRVHVTRAFHALVGRPRVGGAVDLGAYPFGSDPNTYAGLAFEAVNVPTPLGDMPAWLVPGSRDTWVLFVPGMAAGRGEALRAMPAIAALCVITTVSVPSSRLACSSTSSTRRPVG